jgi:hypothetical protein
VFGAVRAALESQHFRVRIRQVVGGIGRIVCGIAGHRIGKVLDEIAILHYVCAYTYPIYIHTYILSICIHISYTKYIYIYIYTYIYIYMYILYIMYIYYMHVICTRLRCSGGTRLRV